jgi:hypothetical protein
MPPQNVRTTSYLSNCLLLIVLVFGGWVSLPGGFSRGFHTTAAAASTLLVTNINDNGAGSLRQAILDANANPGPDVINFSINSGVQRIILSSPLPAISDPLTIDGTTQPGFAGTPILEIRPDDQVIGDGLTITAGNSVVRGLVLNKFRGHAITIQTGGGNVVEGNHIGTEVSGDVAASNLQNGVFILTSTNNRIGGLTPAARNVISGNFGNGVHMALGASGNLVQGNYIGVNASGTAALPNETGVIIFNNAPNNTIGGTTSSARNVISGNRMNGIQIENNSDANVVQGNFVGTNAAGDAAINNISVNIRVAGCNNTRIGGPSSSPGTPPGNVVLGIFVVGGTETLVQGNLIGTNATGTAKLSNFGMGVTVWGDAIVGGSTPGTGNVISGFSTGIATANSGGGAILGNYIGTDITGTQAIANTRGISIGSNIKDTKIGGTTSAEKNVISGNGTGIEIQFNNAIVKGNFIGTDVNGTSALPNTSNGISIMGNSVGNVIGGAQPGEANTIAFNGGNGITVFANTIPGFGPTKNIVRGNSIHSNVGLGIDLGSDHVTLNDSGDSDSGPNGLQNHPNILSVMTGATSLIQGTLNSTADNAFSLDFYVSSACDPSGYGEGATFIGSSLINTGADGNANFTASLPFLIPAGSVVTATATDSTGNTSEFSLCYELGAPGTVQFLSAFYTVAEQSALATITVSRTLGSAPSGTVTYATGGGTATPGSDFTDSSGTLNFAPGETIKSFTVPIVNDSLDENPETINLTLSSPEGGLALGRNTSVINIIDNDPQPTISIDDVTVGEGDSGSTAAVFTLRLSAPSGRSVRVLFNTVGFSAQSGLDFSSIFGLTVTINPGEITRGVPVQILGDNLVEASEIFFAEMISPSNATLGDSNGTGTIIDDDSLVLLTETNSERAISLDSVLFLRDPFPILNTRNFSLDHRTRIMLFATGLKLAPGEDASTISAVAEDSQGGLHPLNVEFVGSVPSFNWLTQVVLALPDELANANSVSVSISLHGARSNKVIIRIQTP